VNVQLATPFLLLSGAVLTVCVCVFTLGAARPRSRWVVASSSKCQRKGTHEFDAVEGY